MTSKIPSSVVLVFIFPFSPSTEGKQWPLFSSPSNQLYFHLPVSLICSGVRKPGGPIEFRLEYSALVLEFNSSYLNFS